jgi:hypothetical protein
MSQNLRRISHPDTSRDSPWSRGGSPKAVESTLGVMEVHPGPLMITLEP